MLQFLVPGQGLGRADPYDPALLDDVVAVGAADPLGLARLLRTHADLLETLDGARVRIVANRVRASVLGIHPHGQVRQTLDRFAAIRDAVLINDDPDAADAALLAALDRCALDTPPGVL